MNKLLLVLLVALSLVGCSGPQVSLPEPAPKPDTPVKPVDKPAKPSKETKTEVVKKGETVKPVEEPVDKPVGKPVPKPVEEPEGESEEGKEPALNKQLFAKIASGDFTLEAIQDLVEAGAEVTSRGPHGFTPLHAASSIGASKDIINYLISKGADINALDELGNTPLHLAMAIRSEETIATLIFGDADTEIVNKAGKKPSDLFPVVNPTELPKDSLITAIKGGESYEAIVALIDSGADVGSAWQHLPGHDGLTDKQKIDLVTKLGGTEDDRQALIAELGIIVDPGELTETEEIEPHVPEPVKLVEYDDSVETVKVKEKTLPPKRAERVKEVYSEASLGDLKRIESQLKSGKLGISDDGESFELKGEVSGRKANTQYGDATVIEIEEGKRPF